MFNESIDRKALFLDFDGVLNNTLFWIHDKSQEGKHRIDPRSIQVLNKFLEYHSSAIVICSTAWRVGRPKEWLTEKLREHGYTGPDIADVTPCLGGCYDPIRKRVAEIEWFLREHPEITCPLALDDMPLDTAWSIQVDSDVGLTYSDLTKAKDIPGWAGFARPIVRFY